MPENYVFKDYGEIICQAIETIVSKRISELKFDETIICEIVDDSRKEEGIYDVLYNDTLRFTAYAAEGKKYSVGSRVYVLIPQGDYSRDKLIQGRYSSSDTLEPIAYSSPLENIQLIDTLIKYNKTLYLTANGDKTNIDFSEEEKLNQAEVVLQDKILLEDIKYLCLKVDTSCLLEDYDVKKGNYGIKIALHTNLGKYEFFLDSAKDMFGNPYSYSTYFTQEQAYAVEFAKEEKLVGFAVQFYQDSNFEYYDGIGTQFQRVPVENFGNIFIQNLHIFFGKDLEDNKEEEINILGNNSEYKTWDLYTEIIDENSKYLLDGQIVKKLFELLYPEKKEE